MVSLDLVGQSDLCDDPTVSEADIKVFSPGIDPNPLPSVALEGTGEFSFVVSNENGSYDSAAVQLVIVLTDVEAIDSTDAISSLVLPDTSSYWDWEYDSTLTTFTGLQNKVINAGYAEQVTIDIRVTANSTQAMKTNGFTVRAFILDSQACNASTTNDSIARRTYTTDSPILPVHVLDFDGTLENNQEVILDWALSDVEYLYEVAVQRSTNGIEWQTIGLVEIEPTNALLLEDSFVDQDPEIRNLYRLEFRELDGSIGYSKIVEISVREPGMSAFPNPTSNILTITGVETDDILILSDMMGRELVRMQGTPAQTINMRNLVGLGQYVLIRFDKSHALIETQKLIVH